MVKVIPYPGNPERFAIEINGMIRLSSKGFAFKSEESAYSFIWGKRGIKSDPDYVEYKNAEIPEEYRKKFVARNKGNATAMSANKEHTQSEEASKPSLMVHNPSIGLRDGSAIQSVPTQDEKLDALEKLSDFKKSLTSAQWELISSFLSCGVAA